MLHVIQTQVKKENFTINLIKKYLPEYKTEYLFPHYEKKIKYCGKWNLVTEPLFPGYIFVKVGNSELLSFYYRIKTIPALTKLLHSETEWTPLSSEEEIFLIKLLEMPKNESNDYIARMSSGIIVNKQAIITEGPLKGLEGLIQKIDRHKKIAYLKINMFQREISLKIGLEILERV